MMNKFIDKASLMAVATILYGLMFDFLTSIVPLLLATILLLLTTLIDNDYFTLICFVALGIACYFLPTWTVFLPTILYTFKKRIFYLSCVIFAPILILHYSVITAFAVLATMLLTVWLKTKTNKIVSMEQKYHECQDNSYQRNTILYSKNQELLHSQSMSVKVATLEERNRIAREIHDNIGHVLSGSILQTGALIATATDESSKQGLIKLKENLYVGMDSIRKSIHNLHEDYIDLDKSINLIAQEFTFCNIEVRCDTKNIVRNDIASAIIAVVKESLSNIIKHSNATNVTISVEEFPGLYKLSIVDNGTNPPKFNEGMGLKNIRERAQSFDGYMNYEYNHGFRITVTFLKKTGEIK